MVEPVGSKSIAVMICDDSALVRLFLKSIVEDDPDMRVVALARNGNEAIELARQFKPDVITLDIDMPGLDGLSALRVIVREKIAPVVMISSLTEEGAGATLEALEIGAFDFLPKPQGKAYYGQSETIVSKLKAAVHWQQSSRNVDEVKPREVTQVDRQPVQDFSHFPDFYGVAVGASTGGPKALIEVVSHLPSDLNAAVFIVQHMPRSFIPPFAKRLASRASMECRIGQHGEAVRAGVIYIADGERQMLLQVNSRQELHIQQTREPKTLFMPSVDVTMQSVAEAFGPMGIGVILTGMGNDGARGIWTIHQRGGQTIAESAKTAVVYGMPQEAVKFGGVGLSLPLPEIPDAVCNFAAAASFGKRGRNER